MHAHQQPAPVPKAQESISQDDWLVTVKVLAEIYADAGKTEPAIRADVFKADDRVNSRGQIIPGNGLAKHDAIVRIGRKLLLRPRRYGNWLAGRAPVRE